MSNLHSIQIEQNVLASLMTVDNSYNSLESKPSQDDFFAGRHKEIILAIENLNIQGKPYDVVMVCDYLIATNKLHLCGGEDYLKTLMADAGSNFYNTPSYIDKLKKLTECRKVEEIGKKIMEVAQNTMIEDMPTVVQEIASGIESHFVTDTRFSLEQSSIEALGVVDLKQRHKANGGKEAYGVNTGLSCLDNLLGDIEPGHYCVVAGAPGGGKTTLAQMVALNAVKTNGISAVFFSCEMAHYEVTSRIVSAQGRIPYANIQSGEMTEDDYTSWVNITAHLFPKYKLDIVDKAGITIQEIRGEIKKSIQKHGSIGCVIVDYIQLVNDHKARDQFEKITNVSMGLKKIAKDFKVPVIALSQLTKEATGRKITMADLRGSGQIAQDADKIILLSPDTKELGVVTAEVAKNRQGKKGEARLLTKFDYCQFANIVKSFE